MATLTVATSGRTTATSYDLASLVAAAGGGDKFANDGQTYFIIKNGDGSDHTVTFAIQQTVDGVTPTAATQNIVAGKTRLFGPFPTGVYNDTSGLVNVTYSAVTSVTVAAVKCPPAG